MVGRPVTTGSASQRVRQAAYRRRLQAARRPEMDDVDRALIGALRQFAGDVALGRVPPADDVGRVKSLMTTAMDRLAAAGYDRSACKRMIIRRLVAADKMSQVVTG